MKSSAMLLLVLTSMLCLACATLPIVPPTPEGNACVRQCLAIQNTCGLGSTGWAVVVACNNQHAQCLATCPGAYLPASPETTDRDCDDQHPCPTGSHCVHYLLGANSCHPGS
jgi:hypothetical protein